MTRLFIALDFPPEIKTMLNRISFGLPEARWVPEDQLHLTLRFIGEVDGALFQDIRAKLGRVRAPELTLTLKGCGFFPPRKKPRVIWVGIAENNKLFQLRNKIEKMVTQTGVEPERRKFSPHITLARLQSPPLKKVTDFLVANSMFSTNPFTVDHFSLYSSFLTPRGAIHTIEADYYFTL
jgi:2'-5' RNA ligase